MPLSILVISAPFVRLWRWLCNLLPRQLPQPALSPPPTTPEGVPPLRVLVSTASALESVWMFRELAGQPVLLDVSAASHVGLPFLRSLSASWPRQYGNVTRLGIRMTFERWARLRITGLPYLDQLAAKGVEAALFYDQQRFANWFAGERIVHDAERVIDHLQNATYDPGVWPRLLEAAAAVIVHQPRKQWAALYGDLAEISLVRGVPKSAVGFANEALQLLLGRDPSPLECRSLRLLGEALYAVGEDRNAVHALKEAVSVATDAGCMFEAGRAAYILGKLALGAADFDLALHWLHRAAVTIGPTPTKLLMEIRRDIAVASVAPQLVEKG